MENQLIEEINRLSSNPNVKKIKLTWIDFSAFFSMKRKENIRPNIIIKLKK